MTPIHKNRSSKDFTECSKSLSLVQKSIVIDESDSVKKDPTNYITHFQKVGDDNIKYVLCDECWKTYDTISRDNFNHSRFISISDH